MPTSAPGNRAGFTLLELLVVVAIIAIASAGVAFALRDAGAASLEREAQRLGALLESARARSRLTGQPVRWVADEQGFHFEGLPRGTLPDHWLDAGTRVVGRGILVLGPEPVIGPQAVVLTSTAHPEQALRIATDGLRPFAIVPEQP
ncbi:prepilin-type N-terminal cleavage/methylation domain-containing protein [Ramlibacter sp. USB13]|uniref:Prepilin-type N-terminal cleavage/methylation domain-containing protein n=1 Tax=Ramlibacter cellulosilyticus TaxID=2764187 RepID=A0A923MTC3_9BURK|nr:prepilin-type N-terminal cleavage/methylation domain-containing protein [Ramlibacter cellulosilyticus]MBC5785045.1 prepilin-type N-terminal cleavage/methylation domain-containing protein [Ramlibacter cellulosilyticus]